MVEKIKWVECWTSRIPCHFGIAPVQSSFFSWDYTEPCHFGICQVGRGEGTVIGEGPVIGDR